VHPIQFLYYSYSYIYIYIYICTYRGYGMSVVSIGNEIIREIEVETTVSRARNAKVGRRYLRGPTPFSSIDAAGALPGSALWVYLIVLSRVNITGKAGVTLSTSVMADHGLTRRAKDRAVDVLEEAGLIRVTRRVGRTSVIFVGKKAAA
jgi:hypothetical protein